MLPTLILYALTIWQLGQFNPPNAGPLFHTVVLSGFDVPPVDGPPGTETLIFYQDCAAHGLAQMAPGVCLQPPKVCADKWRFLLQSADGKFHCVALNPR